ncbi:cell division/cell wall cluster transcriptional repressor MraZ [Candidatus Berkelbacteria bacterium RIFOXYA2_FULL_43_10]|uniref:Transcriptional regulator MraZ n=1 Tax=Candidatus Berkelbacteria bacterium RIFOXYA2_FULL_43_10 TaxID=1797472 RepID=A0A1F5EEI6_9BACT|nr:MAG: cell division/cell wall cluster transcriptional repressor MraZ [Candidatus Berkelbacteria bacterium RIFOXYA2_FULL_43_10]
MFIGEYSHSIDEKGRLSVPVKFRARLVSGCVVTRGLDHCLWLFTDEEWRKIAEKVAALPLTQRDARSFSRLVLAGAMDLTLDKAGRINLPNYLKDYAGIKNKVILTGMYSRIEIWPEENWKNFKQEMEDKSEEIAEGLNEIGI